MAIDSRAARGQQSKQLPRKRRYDVALWLGPVVAVSTLLTLLMAVGTVNDTIPAPFFAVTLTGTAMAWFSVIVLVAARAVIKHNNAVHAKWGKKVMGEIRAARVDLATRELGAAQGERLRSVN